MSDGGMAGRVQTCPALRHVGSTDANQALDRIGVLDAVAAFAFRTAGATDRRGISGRLLIASASGEWVREHYGHDYLRVYCDDLHFALLAALAEYTATVELGCCAVDLREVAEG
jgi:hypothetical protein